MSAAGAAGWVGVARGSGNGPKAPPAPESRPTARLPGERKLFFQKLRGSQRTVCAPQGQVGKWSRRRRGEEAKGGERGAPLPRQVPILGSCPLVFNPLRGVGRSKGEVDTLGQTPTGTRTCSHPPTHPSLPSLPPGNAGLSRVPGGTQAGGGGDEPERDPLYGPPLLLEVAHNFKFPQPGMLVSICSGWGRRAAPPPPESRAPLPSAPASTFCSLLALQNATRFIRFAFLNQRFNQQGLERGSSSAGTPGGGVLCANIVPSASVAFRLLFAKKRLFDAGRNGKF